MINILNLNDYDFILGEFCSPVSPWEPPLVFKLQLSFFMYLKHL